jgi:hypothetical protein
MSKVNESTFKMLPSARDAGEENVSVLPRYVRFSIIVAIMHYLARPGFL